MSNATETWHLIDQSTGSRFVLCTETEYRQRGWYARRADGRRFTLTTWKENGKPRSVFAITVPDGWYETHRSEHGSLRSAKTAAKKFLR